MSAKTLANHYSLLTAEERFRLILAASARGDGAERDRLVATGPRVVMRMSDHAPLLLSFHDVALLVYIELQELAAEYQDIDLAAADALADRAGDASDGRDEGEVDAPEEQGSGADAAETHKRLPWERLLELTYAWGFMLRTKADGWRLFCERLGVPPFGLWQHLPGFDRLQRSLTMTEKAAFGSADFLRWLNRTRKPGEPERTTVPLSVEAVAAGTEAMFREHAGWWADD